MRTIEFYIENAKEKLGFKSDIALARHLGLSNAAIPVWKTRGCVPKNETMIELAKIIGIDPAIALMDAQIWQSKGQTRAVYSRILQKLTAAAIALALLFPVYSLDIRKYENRKNLTYTIYYGNYPLFFKKIRKFFRSAMKQWLRCLILTKMANTNPRKSILPV